MAALKFIFLPPFEIFGRPLSSLHTQPSPAQRLPSSALIEYFKFDEADSWDHLPRGLRLAITVINVPRYRQCIFSLQPAAMINGTIASLTGLLGSRNKFQDSGRSEEQSWSMLQALSICSVYIPYSVSIFCILFQQISLRALHLNILCFIHRSMTFK